MRAALLLLLLACAPGALSRGAPYLIESGFEPARAYVGAEVTLRLRLLRAAGVPYGVLRPPQLGDAAELTPFGYVRYYETRRAGVAYEARERRYLVVPRRAGPLVLPGPELDGPLRYSKAHLRAVRGAPRVLEVLPARAAAGAAWLPARRVTLEESWSRDPLALEAGLPVVRTLTLRAEGISGDRLPRLEMAAAPGLSAHREPGEYSSAYLEAGVAGQRVQKFVLMALEEGEVALPAVALDWWDVAADQPRTAALPARVLRVGAAAPAAAQAPAPPAEVAPQALMQGFALTLFALCILVLVAYVRGQVRREATMRLKWACRRGDAAAVREALVEWWKAETGSEAAPLVQGIGEGWSAEARAQLAALDAALYGGRPLDARAFWRGVKPWLGRRKKPRAARAAPLPPLFRLQGRA